MANIQFCPVCGYALKKVDTQCGRCGESVGDEMEKVQPPRQRQPASRFLSGYSIESIGAGGDTAVDAEGGMPITESYGIREVGQKEGRASAQAERMESLQRELKDLNERIARMDEQKLNEAAAARPAVQPSPRRFKSDVVKHFRRRSDDQFRNLVGMHVAALREGVRKAGSEGKHAGASYHPFIDAKIVNPGVYEGSVVLFAGPSGSMKSTMAAAAVADMARRRGVNALYIILDEGSTRFQRRLEHLGIQNGDGRPIRIVDSTEIRDKCANMEGNWRQVMMQYIRAEFRRLPFEFMVVDNLNAVSSMVSGSNERAATFEFFELMRALGITAIAVREGDYSRVVRAKSADAYLADGVIQFHRRKGADGSLAPMFRVLKMRGADIDSRYYSLQVSSGSLRFVPAVAT